MNRVTKRCLLAGLFLAGTGAALLYPGAGNLLLAAAVLLSLGGARVAKARAVLWRLSAALLYACATALVLALLLDRFDFRYVWLYSSPTLPVYLKAANLWGGDEGTLILLAVMFTPLALRHAERPGWEGVAAGLLAAWYATAALLLGPFAPTPDSWLASQDSQGMNAHLQKIWMALHAPAILAAYVWAIAPVGAAIQALRGAANEYAAVTLRYNRRAWFVLTAGIGFGMVWALGDFTFGQLWHWDPVQTSAFIVWVMLAAVLHGARHWRPGGAFGRTLPVLSLLLAASTSLAMAVTRSETLASSHRYIGTTSWLSHLALAVLLVAAALAFACRPLAVRRRSMKKAAVTTRLSVWLFVALALIASSALALAYLRQWFLVAKPVDEKPFFETLTLWASAQEIEQLRAAFAQWSVDGYWLAHRLLPLLLAVGMLGGYTFLRRAASRSIALAGTAVVALMCLALWWHGGLLSQWYEGRGVLSSRVVSVLPWLDASLAAAGFLLLACLYWCVQSIWCSRRLGATRLTGSLAFIHGGAVIALMGGFAATALNTYQAIQVAPDKLGQLNSLAEGWTIRVSPASATLDHSGYRAVAQVEVSGDGETAMGNALFLDGRHQPAGYQGPVRQLCEILDFRYARYAGGPRYLLDPFVLHGWLEDRQIWVPATPALLGDKPGEDIQMPALIVLRSYPLVSLVWTGLVMMLVGTLLLPGRLKGASA